MNGRLLQRNTHREITLKLFLFLCLSLHSIQDKGGIMSRALSKHCDNNKFNC